MNTAEDLEQHLLSLEQHLLEPASRRAPPELQALLCDDFFEFGSSGRVFDKSSIIAALGRETAARYAISEFKLLKIADDAALVTYRVIRQTEPSGAPVESLRSSLWRRIDGQWKMAFHQGTFAAARSA